MKTLLLNIFNENSCKKYCDLHNAVKYYFVKHDLAGIDDDGLIANVTVMLIVLLQTLSFTKDIKQYVTEYISSITSFIKTTNYEESFDLSFIFKTPKRYVGDVVASILSYPEINIEIIETELETYGFASKSRPYSLGVYIFLNIINHEHFNEYSKNDLLKNFLIRLKDINDFIGDNDEPEKCIEYIYFN